MPVNIAQLISLPNLGPGSKGEAVRTLQQWLVENGYLTQAQMNTGPGIYGPKTKTAVERWQVSQNLNTQGNPGYFGPLSKSFLQSKIAPPPTPVVPVAPPAPTAPPATPAPPPTPTAPTAPTTPTAPTDITQPVEKAEFKNTASYKALPQAAKDFVDMSYNLIVLGGEEEARLFSNAVDQAKAVADPYYKTQLSLAKAEVLGSIAEKSNDYETRAEIIKRTRDELLEDVKSNKEFLTLEQQAEIARTARVYDEDLLSIADQAAEKGLTFATGARSRALAESRRAEQYSDVVESSRRRFNFQVKELELKAARGETDAQKQLEALQSQKGFALQQIGRAAEEVLGTANAPTIPGYTPTGDVLGKIEEEKRKSILSDVAGFTQLQKGFI